jgi:23S rRNA (adenine-N6)-dimethyltransferase
VLVRNLIKLSHINCNDFVIEIGPGKGIITSILAISCKKLLAIEYDHELYKILHSRFLNSKNVTLLHQDFLKTDLPNAPYKVFSNIPFNMTADILNKLLNADTPPLDLYLVMQKEAVFKYSGEPYCENCLKSLGLKPIYDVKIIHHFSPRDFYPRPKAEIVLVHFHKKNFCDIDMLPMTDWYDFFGFCFYFSRQIDTAKNRNALFTASNHTFAARA